MLSEQLTRISRPSRGAFLGALVLIVTFGMYQWILAPHTLELSAAQRYEGLMEGISKKNESSKKLLAAKEKKLAELSKNYEELSVCLFDGAGAKKFYSELASLAEQSKCKVNSLNSLPGRLSADRRRAERASGISSQSVRLSVVGSYGGIIDLTGRLNSYQPKVYVDSMALELLGASRQLKCEMTITIYVVDDKEAVSK